ncbi:MAG: SdiA-regulated [Bacteroidota bacterium]
MTRTQYFFSFVLATISFIAARSIQRQGIQNYYEQVAAGVQKELGAIDFEHPVSAQYLPMGLQPFTALTTLDSLHSFAVSQDSLHIVRYDNTLNAFAPLFESTSDLKITQIAGFDSTLVYLDEAQDLHFLNAPFDEATSESYPLQNEDGSKQLLCYHPNLKRILVLNSSLLENGERRFVCQTFHTTKRQLSQVPLFAFDSKELLFEPISFAIQPQSNELYLLSSTGEVVILDQHGDLLSRHQLPEGISAPKLIHFTASGDLLATDASTLHPVIMRLPWQKSHPDQGPLVH